MNEGGYNPPKGMVLCISIEKMCVYVYNVCLVTYLCVRLFNEFRLIDEMCEIVV